MSLTGDIDKDIAQYKLRKKRESAKERAAQRYEEVKAERAKYRNPCQMVLTGNRGRNGRTLVVRCYCMSGYRFSPYFYHYDPLGVVGSITEARALWDSHRRTLEANCNDLPSV